MSSGLPGKCAASTCRSNSNHQWINSCRSRIKCLAMGMMLVPSWSQETLLASCQQIDSGSGHDGQAHPLWPADLSMWFSAQHVSLQSDQ
jgi:hypothetical protein